MRQSFRPDQHENVTILDIGTEGELNQGNYAAANVVGLFFDWLVDMIRTISREFPAGNVLAGAIADPANLFREYGRASQEGEEANLQVIIDSVDTADFSHPFAQFINPYWINLTGWQLATGSAEDFTPERTTTTSATIIDSEDYIACHVGWLLAFTIATAIALLYAMSRLGLALLCKGPRLSWDVSTAVRENPFVVVPASESYLDDDERSRTMSDTRAMLGDVTPREQVGHIAIASIGTEGSLEVKKLQKGRLYS